MGYSDQASDDFVAACVENLPTRLGLIVDEFGLSGCKYRAVEFCIRAARVYIDNIRKFRERCGVDMKLGFYNDSDHELREPLTQYGVLDGSEDTLEWWKDSVILVSQFVDHKNSGYKPILFTVGRDGRPENPVEIVNFPDSILGLMEDAEDFTSGPSTEEIADESRISQEGYDLGL